MEGMPTTQSRNPKYDTAGKHISFPREFYERLKRAADERGLPMSTIIELAVHKALGGELPEAAVVALERAPKRLRKVAESAKKAGG